MIISIVVAMDENGLIGSNGRLPWELPIDMARFRKLTMGKSILIGRRTLESIGEALDGRVNIVLSRNLFFRPAACIVVGSISEAICSAQGIEELMVIGGRSVFKQFLDRGVVDRLYITKVHHSFVGDVYFPPLNKEDWEESEHIENPADERNPYSCAFLTWQRRIG